MKRSRNLLISLLIFLILCSGCSNKDELRKQSSQLYKAIYNNDVRSIQKIVDQTKLDKLPKQDDLKPEVLAAALDEYEATKLILEAGGSWKSKDLNGNNLLQIAAVNGNKKLMSYLLIEKKANINMENELGLTPLHLAIAPSATNDHRKEVVEWLIKKGANPLSQSEDGSSAMHIAALQNQPDVINYLLQFKQMINLTDQKGRTPLIIAVQSGNKLSVQELLNNGSDVNVKDKDGKTAMNYAEGYGLVDIQLLLK